MRFRDRTHAGRELAAEVVRRTAPDGPADPLVLALPRGGLPVAAEVARALDAPLDVLVVRKVGTPGWPEAAVGALAGEDPPVFDPQTLRALDLTEQDLAPDVARERAELHRREEAYRRGRPAPEVAGRTVVVVDDGIATGATATAGLRHLRARHPAELVLAVPVCSPTAARAMSAEADALVCVHQPPGFRAVGEWYDDFAQVPDADVIAALDAFRPAP